MKFYCAPILLVVICLISVPPLTAASIEDGTSYLAIYSTLEAGSNTYVTTSIPVGIAIPSRIWENIYPGNLSAWKSRIPNWNRTPYIPKTRNSSLVPADSKIGMVYLSDLDVRYEYVKLTNRGRDSVVMTGWKISNRDGSRSIRFAEWKNPDGSKFNYELRGFSTVTIYSGMEGTPSQTRLYWPQEMWNDEADTAYLYNETGKLVSTRTDDNTFIA